MLFAAIDVGSNAARLLFANVFEIKQKIFVEKATLVRIPIRLGKDVYNINHITKKRADNLIKTLHAYRLLIEVYKPVAYDACATAAMREAENGLEIINRIKEDTGFNIRIIDGITEANIIRRTNKIGFEHPDNLSMYIDVGGGSTDISIMDGERVIDVKSFKIGTLRILSGKMDKKEWDRLGKWLKKFNEYFGALNLVGSGGNINKINKLYGDPFHYTLSFENLTYAHKFLKGYSLMERIEKLGLRPDRADVIVPAAKIFIYIMKIVKSKSVLVPKIGLADGLIYQLYEKQKLMSAK
ncbi:MAG: Ppx/GppA family phosphatase [Bacteroidales bacterium]|nr:Ppx/GppA family phosphatase [Bacteroidales bacterium]